MLKLTKFTGDEVFINPSILKSVESGVDTLVVLTTGERLLVRENAQEIQEQFIAYNKEIRKHQGLSPSLQGG